VDALVPEILAALRDRPSLVLEAPPGAGKTTRVPPALLSLTGKDVLVLEPRRLAARLAARRVAFELGERPGETVGYQVRFEEVAGPRTRLRFLTEGLLARRLLSDPLLERAGIVVLDEFHERHLEGDLALALLRRLQQTRRPDLRLLVMSATLEGDRVAAWLGSCPILRSDGRLFDLSIEYRPASAQPLEEQVADAAEGLFEKGHRGHTLVFLPGAAEIRRAARATEGIARRAGVIVLPLHGDLSPQEQDRAVEPCAHPKLILATNVAESSITIDGVTAVIDSGLARIARDSPWTGLPSLEIGKISQASARQRAGRAGRTAPGRVIRLYSEEDYLRRPAQDQPEILRRELAQMVLDLRAMGIGDLDWLDAPPEPAFSAAVALLEQLGALSAQGGLTDVGRRMARLPLHPRLARLLIAAEDRGLAETGCRMAAVLSAGERLPEAPRHSGPSDLLELAERDWLPQTRRTFEQLRRLVAGREQRHDDESAQLAVLNAFPDRVARRRKGPELLLASGGSAILSASSVVTEAPFLVCVDAEERRDKGIPMVRLASAVEPEWLIELFPERVREESGLEWNKQVERVDRISRLWFDCIVLEESRQPAPYGSETAAILAAQAAERGIDHFTSREEFEALLARLAFAAERGAARAVDPGHLETTLAALCQGRRSFAELRQADLLAELRARCAGPRFDEVAPERIRLPRGRSVVVHYEAGKAPWIQSRLQDFFGMQETPRVGDQPVVVHLLAPNQRPVQMTTDLAGFWQRLYPQVRKELMRRYPKHAWPERPESP
jgi:ATP-dependent helicase HrpB